MTSSRSSLAMPAASTGSPGYRVNLISIAGSEDLGTGTGTTRSIKREVQAAEGVVGVSEGI